MHFINYNKKKKTNKLSCENINNNIVNTGSNIYNSNNVNKLYNKLIIKNKKLNINIPSKKNLKEKKQNPIGLKVSASDFNLRKKKLIKIFNTCSQKNITNKQNNNNFTINTNIIGSKKTNIMESNLTNFNNNIPRNRNNKNQYHYYNDKNNDSLRNRANSYILLNNQENNKKNTSSVYIYNNNMNKTLNQTNIINNNKKSSDNNYSNNNNSTSDNQEMLLQNVNININNQININKDFFRHILNDNNISNKYEFNKKNNIKEESQKEFAIHNSDKKNFLSRNKNKNIEFNCLNSINSMKSNFNSTNSNINFGQGMNNGFVLVHTKDYGMNFPKNSSNFHNKNKLKISTKNIFNTKKNSYNKVGKCYNNKNLESNNTNSNKNHVNYEKDEEVLNYIKKNNTYFLTKNN